MTGAGGDYAFSNLPAGGFHGRRREAAPPPRHTPRPPREPPLGRWGGAAPPRRAGAAQPRVAVGGAEPHHGHPGREVDEASGELGR